MFSVARFFLLALAFLPSMSACGRSGFGPQGGQAGGDHGNGGGGDSNGGGGDGGDGTALLPILISEVRCPSGAGTYLEGNPLRVEVDFSAPVTTTGAPTLNLTLGATTRAAALVSATSQTLTFVYTLEASDNDSDGVVVESPVIATPTEIRDAAGSRPVDLTFPPLVITGSRVGGPVTIGGFVWIGGDATTNVVPIISGTPGQANATNSPGSRAESSTWVDDQGRLWLFGGTNRVARGRNELWWMDPQSRQWAFVAGTNADNPDHDYTVGSAIPAGRTAHRAHLLLDGRALLVHGTTIKSGSPPDQYRATNGLWSFSAADVAWTWLGGRDHYNDNNGVVWGTPGVADPANLPGPRYGHCTWLDEQGRVWLMGGNTVYAPSTSGGMADLWRYDPATNEWTFIGGPQTPTAAVLGTKGVEAPNNWPRLWFNQPTCMQTSDGNFWLFGGAAQLNIYRIPQLWRYRPSSGQWTWMGGPAGDDTSGVYGTQGVGAPANAPGAREGAIGWVDGRDDLWIFGGHGFDEAGTRGGLSDLWRFHVPSGEWIWVGGPKVANDPGNFGSLDVSASSNWPPSRHNAPRWQVGDSVWMYGGGNSGYYRDLWRLDP